MQKSSMTEAQKLLWRQRLEAGARQDAWTFIVQQEWNLDAIRVELAEKEEFRVRPSIQGSLMAPGASPRICIDVCIATLKEAIEIIEIQQVEPAATLPVASTA